MPTPLSRDRYCGEHSTASRRAIAAYETAVWAILAHRPDGAAALAEAIVDSPDFIAAVALRGFCGVSLARAETVEAARADSVRARALLARHGGTAYERALVDALDCAVEGRLRAAADRLELRLQDAPRDALALKLAHGLRFLAGDAKGMLAATRAAMLHWSPASDGYGFALGCHAFALEENGYLAEAEATGREAVGREPCDAWGAHAVGHVFEMRADAPRGMAWLEQTRPLWSACNNFSFHMAWHLALCQLAQGRTDLALALYDTHVRPLATDDFRDVANAVSLLWRLRQDGVDGGERWRELAGLARKRAGDPTLVFASLHHLLTAMAVGDEATARLVLANLRTLALSAASDQGRVAREIGVDVARALTAASSPTPLVLLAQKLDGIGGSRAQRDVFTRTLALAAIDDGDADQVDMILRLRAKTAADRFEHAARERLAARSSARQVA